jgi:putative endonuclease
MISLLYRAADAIRRRTYRDDHGRIGEDLAHRYLRRHGCTIVARNYRPPSGAVEIDLIVRQGQTLAFVEVKTRSAEDFGPPESAVDREKRSYIERAARDYAARVRVDWKHARFDIVTVVLESPPRIEWRRKAWRPSTL